MCTKIFRPIPVAATFMLCLATAASAQTRALTANDYARAERFLGYNTTPLVLHVAAQPTWVGDDRFWYRTSTENGTEFFLVDAATGMKAAAFDQAKVAAALSTAASRNYATYRLPFNRFDFSADRKSISFNTGGSQWTCDVAGTRCESKEGREREPVVVSPDGKRAAFIRNYNLWVRDTATGKETQLTKDGVKEYGYATDNAGWIHSGNAVLLWSPDSKKIATFQQDERGTGEMYLVSTSVGHPRLEAWKYPLAGDPKIFMIERVVIDVDRARVVRLQIPPDPHRSSVCDDVECNGPFEDVEWAADGRQLAFLSSSRDHKEAHLRVADAETGKVRQVLEEKVATYYESGNDAHNWRFLPASNEVIWFSERDNWGQLYLYDLQTGRLKNQITTGDGNVTQMVSVDEKNRVVYFRGVGKEKGRDPYFIHLYRIGLDGRNLTLLTPEDATHVVAQSPAGRYFVDSYSKPDVAPTFVLRDADGRLIATLERADISRLVATGWKPPQPIVVKARDGMTDLYGLLYPPTNLNSSAKYPIINHIYPGPQTGSVGPRNFMAARGDSQALAELGFVVVEIDGMGTPWRSKKFHDAYFGDMGDNTLPDQVAGMKDLAAKYPWIDLDRVGIWGHSGGGYATAGAMFHYPDFFKVGISESGNHDNRNYEDDWAEKWQGLLEKTPGATNYDSQANQNFAKNLKGKLLLAHGTMDDNVPPSNTLVLVDELIKANKDFDLLLMPNRHHGYAAEPYMIRRRWDYFVRNLLGAEPPPNYELRPPAQ
ncbi:MAG: S9 family peptidase [Acidobacteria bacterium]|nr:MAG: S9 family peptidase [Acidobacteriota bacterium]